MIKSLFLPRHLKTLEAFTKLDNLYAFDFDGTLAPIVSVAARAKMSRETAALLKELNQFAAVAIITGRSLHDLKSRIPFDLDHIVGNHGMEFSDFQPRWLSPAKRICTKWKSQLQTTLLTGENSDSGIEFEDKVYSFSIHYRRCRNQKTVYSNIMTAVGELTPQPRLVLGKLVVNLIPPGNFNKGAALQELLKRTRLKSAFYIGDDVTDEDVFSLHDKRIFTVHVGSKRTSQADYFIKEQPEINLLLRHLIKFHRLKSHPTLT